MPPQRILPARRRPAISLLLAALPLLTATPAWAHEEGALRLANRALVAGERISLAGEKFGPRSELALFLVGVRGRLELGKVRTDSVGAFKTHVVLPSDAEPGVYRLVALAADGDPVAALDVTMATRGADDGPEQAGRGEPGEESQHPTAEPLVLDRARHGAVTGVAIVMAVLALGGGVALLRAPRGG